MSAPPTLALYALPPLARVLAALLRAWARLALLLLLVALVGASDPPLTPLALAEGLALFALAPELAALALLRAYAANTRIAGGVLEIARADRVARIPLARITALAPARLPLPLPTLALGLARGESAGSDPTDSPRVFEMRLALRDPRALLLALHRAGCAGAGDALGARMLHYVNARIDFGRRWWLRWPARIAAFTLLPGAVALSAHQHIAFGAFFGEWLLMGPRAWLLSALVHYATAAMYLVLWSALWRAVAEAIARLGARGGAARAAATRALAEHATSAIYYGSVPTLLALRFLA